MKDTNLRDQIYNSAIWSIFTKIFQQAYSFSVSIYVARILGPKDFGVMAIAMTLIVYLNSLTGFGLTNSLINQKEVSKTQINAMFTINFIVSITIYLLCVLFKNNIAMVLNITDYVEILPALALIIIVTSFYNQPMALLRKQLNFKLHSIIDFIQYILTSSVMLIMAIYGYGIWSLVWGQLIGYITSALLLLFVSAWKPAFCFSFSSLRNMLGYGLWDSLKYNVNYLEEYFSYYVISNYIDPKHLGYFDRANSFSILPQRIIQVQLNAVLFSAYSKLHDNVPRLQSAFNKSLTLFSCIIMPVMVGMIMISDNLINLLLGDDWISMIPLLKILCLAGIFRMLSSFFKNYNMATFRYRTQTYIEIVTAVLTITCCLIGVKYGNIGISYAILLSSITAFAINIVHSITLHNINIYDVVNDVYTAVISSSVMALCIYYYHNNSLTKTYMTNLIAMIFIGIATYTISCLIFSNSIIKSLAVERFNRK